MNLDVRSLRAFNRLAHPGVEKAAGSLTTLAGIDTYVNVTKVELRTRSNAENESAEYDLVNVHVGSSDGLDGHTVLAFSPEPAERLAGALMPGIDATSADGEFAESSLKEVTNIMLGGFIDGWADYPDTTVDITTSTYVNDENNGPLDHVDAEGFENGGDDKHVLVFRNQLKAMDNAIESGLYMVPTISPIGATVGVSGGDGALLIGLSVTFSEMMNDNAIQVPKDITAMTGIDTTVGVSWLSFVFIENVSMSLTDVVQRGVALEFSETPGGYIAILFDKPSAENIINSLLPGIEGSEAVRQSAIQGVGNITTSSFLDGWANALETTIDILPSKYVHDIGSIIIDSLATDLAQSQEYAFLIDSTIRADDDGSTCDIYALPDETELRRAFKQLSPAARPLRRGISMQVYTTDIPMTRPGRIEVGIVDFVVSSDESTLTTSGPGSYTSVALYDPETGVSGLAHTMLPKVDDGSEPVKFVDAGVEPLITEMQTVGADTNQVVIKTAGGSTMFDFTPADGDGSIGNRNVAAT